MLIGHVRKIQKNFLNEIFEKRKKLFYLSNSFERSWNDLLNCLEAFFEMRNVIFVKKIFIAFQFYLLVKFSSFFNIFKISFRYNYHLLLE